MAGRRIILASNSPRRYQLLAQAGYRFQVVGTSSAVETPPQPGESADELVRRLALAKAADAARRVAPSPASVIIAADTVAECNGQILGKPADIDHARQMLQTLSGRQHRVLTGLCLWLRPEDRRRLEVAESVLVMDPLDDAQLEAYLDGGGWRGKAGAFGYQDGPDWLRLVSGTASNVVGLPMQLLAQMLEKLEERQ